jgi:predicted RNA-binding Zn ribbon-like protein
MIRATWEWLGQAPALDLANTVTVEKGIDRDLWATPGGYERWAKAEAVAGDGATRGVDVLLEAKSEIVAVRGAVREAVAAASRREHPPRDAVRQLNAASRVAPEWLEVDANSRLVSRAVSSPKAQLVARYARSALRIVAAAADANVDVRRCPAPSCGMFFEPARSDQTWCSRPCGTRARVARHQLRTRRA